MLNNYADFNDSVGMKRDLQLNLFGRLHTSIKLETLPKEKNLLKRFHI